ncbi:unnamed protein product [Didymodactylos carnosus]|uniref:Glycylpeptide N-tetradecanoyltransferase n=2 Tax=Didymodactylos carnosus TaxID=1234261 RepID=A0A8S2ETV1_9BILA|nr:unnamed protein product [Didymodactylos carnosus]CAF4061686.1 unnamed protein product [Didymodactylos carnosus]
MTDQSSEKETTVTVDSETKSTDNGVPSTTTTTAISTESKTKKKKDKSGIATVKTSATADNDIATASGGSLSLTANNKTDNEATSQTMKSLLKMSLAERAHSAPKSDEELSKQEWKFWQTQPVPRLGSKIQDNNGPVEENKPQSEIRQEPYKLPDGFVWEDIDILNDNQLHELYVLLNENYVEDDDNMFRFDYSMPFLRWALCAPGWIREWHVAVRVIKSRKMVGFISAVPIKMHVYDKEVPMVEINFLCVHKKLRLKRMAPVLIKEITRRVNFQGIFQAAYTAGVILPGLVAKCRYWHRSLNVKKLLAVEFSHLARNMTLQRTQKLYRLPEATQIKGFREMRDEDIPQAWTLLTQYLKKFDLAPIFAKHEFEYLCSNRPNIVSSYVVENDGEVTDFISYYHLSSTIMNHPQYKTLNAGYLYYHATSKTPLIDLVTDCLVTAHMNEFDVFNALDLMDNKEFLEKLKFGVGDGNLQYYIYNWKCPQMSAEKASVALLLQ